MFGLRRLRTAIRLVRFGYNTFTGCVATRVAPIPPFPLFIRSVCNTNRLKAVPLRFVRQLRNNTAQSLVLRTQGLPHGKNKRTSACISKMKAKFLSCGKRSTKNQGEQLQLVVVEAKGASVRRKLDAPISRRRCGSHPKYAHSVYKNALNKFSFIRLRQRRAQQADNLAKLRFDSLSVLF